MKYIIVSVEGIRLIRGKKGFYEIDMYIKRENDPEDAPAIRIKRVYTVREWDKVEKDGYFIEN